MVSLTSEQFDHLIRVLTVLCLVMGMVGALVMQLLQGLITAAITKVIYLIDRKHRIDMSLKRAARWRRIGERFLRVARSMERRQAHRDSSGRVAAAPSVGGPTYQCACGYHVWDGELCASCGAAPNSFFPRREVLNE